MAAFAYRAIDAGGTARRGVVEAASAPAAGRLLRERQLMPLAVTAAAGGAAGSTAAGRRGPRGVRLRGAVLAAVTRQLATLAGSGIMVEEALRLIAAQASPAVAALLLDIRGRILDGQALASALAAHPDSFPEFFRASVAAGEASGRLDHILGQLAASVEDGARAAGRLKLALLYPALLAAVSLAMIVLLLVYVVPDIVRVFASHNATLPLLTRALIAVSGVAVRDGPVLLAGLGLVTLAVMRWRTANRERLDRWLATLPPVAGFVRRIAAARFAAALATLVDADVPLVEAIAIAAVTTRNRHVITVVRTVAGRVREGTSLRAAMAAAGIFPPLLTAIVASGEASGKLAPVLARAAKDLQRDVDAEVAAFVALAEPAVLLAMGGVVLVLVLAILLPIIGLNTLAGA